MKSRRAIWLVAVLAMVLSILACGAGTGGDTGSSDGETGSDDQSSELVTDDEEEGEQEPTEEPEELPTATPEPTPTPEPEMQSILLVAEDDLSKRTDFTSFDEIGQSLDSLGVEYETRRTQDGYPTVGELEEYSVVIWSVGDDCCDSPGRQSAEAIAGYVESGGNLFIEGGSILYAWAYVGDLGQYQEYLGATRADFTALGDIVVATEHPVTEGFGASPIDLNVTSRVAPDVFDVMPGSEVLFVRGPNSASRDRAAIIAVEDGDSKVVYSAASVQWMPNDVREQLIENMLAWFSQ